jgi:hypothetical protein
MKFYLFYIILALIQGFEFIKNNFFQMLGNKMMIYLVNNHKKEVTNVSLSYYLSKRRNQMPYHRYYCKIYGKDKVNHFMFVGSINTPLSFDFQCVKKNKRKNIILLNNNDEIINFDLSILDNYYNNLMHLKEKYSFCYRQSLLNMKLFFICQGIDCHKIKIISHLHCDLHIKVCSVDNLLMSDLYESPCEYDISFLFLE